MQDQLSAAGAQRSTRLVEIFVLGAMLTLMFAGALLAIRLAFGLIDTARNAAYAAEIARTEIEDLRHTPWAVLTDHRLTAPERATLVTTASTPAAEARQFAATRLILDAPDGSDAFVRVLVSVAWTDAFGWEHARDKETTLERGAHHEALVAQLSL